MSSCCGCSEKKKWDKVLWISSAIIVLALLLPLLQLDLPYATDFSHSVRSLLQTMALGLLFGILFISILTGVPQSLIFSIIGRPGSAQGVVRATIAGIGLDLCNHGILLVGMQLYKKGASLGQVFAFLIASPWNSFSLTIILFSLIGFWWTVLFIVASMIIGLVTGLLVDLVFLKKDNPPADQFTKYSISKEWKSYWKSRQWSPSHLLSALWNGLQESKMLLRWIFLGVILTALIQTFVSTEHMQQFFGASMVGLLLTLLASTIIEVCSEGSLPIASDIFTRAAAPGNSFTFLMAGASTDYTEIMLLRETTGKWSKAFLLPLLTVPQILVIAWLMNS